MNLALLALLALSSRSSSSSSPAVSLTERLAWLAGCWEGRSGERTIQEQWMRPQGGSLLGMGRTVKDGRTVDFEFMRIEERDGKLVFTAKPHAQAEASFAQGELTSSSVMFENPEHDFPQRIVYRLLPDGTLGARIEGKQDGKPIGVDFPMKRVACDAPAR